MPFQHSGTMTIFPKGLAQDFGRKCEISSQSNFL